MDTQGRFVDTQWCFVGSKFRRKNDFFRLSVTNYNRGPVLCEKLAHCKIPFKPLIIPPIFTNFLASRHSRTGGNRMSAQVGYVKVDLDHRLELPLRSYLGVKRWSEMIYV